MLPINEILPKLLAIGLVKNNKPISFSAFKKLADAHCYTGYSGRKFKIYIIYVGTRDNNFGFYPPRTTLKESLEIAYSYYLDLFTEMKQEWMDKNVCWGNCGIPLSYSKLRVNLSN